MARVSGGERDSADDIVDKAGDRIPNYSRYVEWE